MSVNIEFATVDLVVQSGADTRGVDAFALSVIKAERQIRRLFTHTVFQSPHFGSGDIAALRTTLWDQRGCYFEGFVRGIDGIVPVSLAQSIGAHYGLLRGQMDKAIDVRNKIFHGQLTDQKLSRADLLAHVSKIRAWCQAVADAGTALIGYDGFERSSFRKGRVGVAQTFKVTLQDVPHYRRFLEDWVTRRPNWQVPPGW
jgi:hypothetical protein